MNRTEHLAWCKERAMEYVHQADYKNAVTSMLSDMDKHPETKLNNPFLTVLGMKAAMSRDHKEVERFILGFN
jgi:hypothetical protein